MSRLDLAYDMPTILMKMSDGNPGAISCLFKMLGKTDWFNKVPGLMHIVMLDSFEIYGENLYILWNDCCHRDLTEMELVLRNLQMGHLTKEELFKNLSSGRGTPFTNLKPLDEIFKPIKKQDSEGLMYEKEQA